MMTPPPARPVSGARSVPRPTGADAHADVERRVRRIRRIIITWFCACLLATLLLSLTVDLDRIDSSAGVSEEGRDGGSLVLGAVHPTG